MSQLSAFMYPAAAHVIRHASPGDFASRPIYTIEAEQIPGMLPSLYPGDNQKPCLAFAGGRLTSQVRWWLEGTGKFNGDGFTWVIYRERVKKLFPPQCTDADKFRIVLGLMVHEMGHVLDHLGNPLMGSQKSALAHLSRLNVDADWKAYHAHAPQSTDVGHGAPWIRATLHLWHRVARTERLPTSMVRVAGRFYRMRDASLYAGALAPELLRRAKDPITEVLGTKPPEAFIRLWKREFRR